MLLEIHISGVRNIESANIQLGETFNVFFGENGSGKTSVLESIYLLATSKSFRSIQARKIINVNNHSLTVFGRIQKLNDVFKVGLEKRIDANTIRINGNDIRVLSELLECLPVLVVEQDSHKLLESGPLWRRKFIDWGLFHVKHDFTSIWRDYRKSLKQRNILLVQNAASDVISSWTQGLVSLGERYSALREEYLSLLVPYFIRYANALLGDENYSLVYKRGWPKDVSLNQCLCDHLHKDRIRGRTSYGPHRADLLVKIQGKDARDHVSRGQQKLLVYALNLAQVSLLKEVKQKQTLLLLDDLGSELDVRHSTNLLSLLQESFGQVCITTASLDSVPVANMKKVKLFHVEHGKVTEV